MYICMCRVLLMHVCIYGYMYVYLVIINRDDKEVTMIEISTPFDAFLETCYTHKFDKHLPLSIGLNNLVFRTKIFCISNWFTWSCK